MQVKAIPEGYHSITPYLSVNGAAQALEFYKQAFDAAECFRLVTPAGKIGHAEIRIGDSSVMLADTCDEGPLCNPQTLGASSIGLYLYVDDADALFAKAVAAGAKIIRPMADQFYGDRTGTLEDPFGHVWFIATHKEELTPEEIHKRAEALFAGHHGA